jgi:predicted O-methyltransferase YrrM
MEIFWTDLFRKYDSELRQVAHCLRRQFHTMQRLGHGATFGDVEGELVYMLLRETRPEVVFEISPHAGWSTNYILASLTANGKGTLHSFDILTEIKGVPMEQVIRSNQWHQWDQKRLVVHIGDARQTVVDVDGPVNFLLLDSCHEDWFAKWYIESVFPRMSGPVIIQDIAFADQMEPSSEARYVWDWADREHIQLTLFGSIEASLEHTELRSGYPERRALRSNSVMFEFPPLERGGLPKLADSPEMWVEQGKSAIAKGDYAIGDRFLSQTTNYLLHTPTRVNRHRLFLQAGKLYNEMGETGEAQRCFQRALGIVLQADAQQRIKGMGELVGLFVSLRKWRLAMQTGALILFEPGARWNLIKKVISLFRVLLRVMKTK